MLQQIPALARDVLQTAQDTEAIVATRTSQVYAMQGVGALAAAILAAYFSRYPRKGLLLTVGQIIFIAALIMLSFTSSLALALILMIFIGYGSVSQLVSMNTIIQIAVSRMDCAGVSLPCTCGRLQGVAPFGSLLIGASAQGWGVPFSMLVSGLIMLAAFGGLHLTNPGVRHATA